MKSLFNTTLVKEQLKRFWVIGALSFLVYFLGCLLPIWNAGSVNGAARYMLSIFEMKHPIVIIMNILAPLVAVIVMFSYMYRSNSAGVMQSLPFTKKQLFASNILAGYLIVILPLILFALLIMLMPVSFPGFHDNAVSYDYNYYMEPIALNIFPGGLEKGDIINTLPVVFGFIGRALLSFTFYYVVCITAAMIVGNQIIYFFMSGFIPFIAGALYLLFGLAAYFYVYGYTFDNDILGEIFVYTNPLLITVRFTYVWAEDFLTTPVPSVIPCYIVYCVIAAVLLAFSAWLNYSRRLERAGDTVVFEPLKNFFIFLISVLGMVALGSLLLALIRSIAFMYFGFVIGFIITFFIAQMIAERTFNVFYKFKALIKHGSVALIIFALIITTAKMDITGYERYIPEPTEIIGLNFGWTSSYSSDADQEIIEASLITDPRSIEESMMVHQQIIDAKSDQRSVFLQSIASNYRDNITRVTHRINYHMNDGKIISRDYVLSEDFYKSSGIDALMRSEAVALSEAFWLKLPHRLNEISINPMICRIQDDKSYTYHDYLPIRIVDAEEISSLTEALKMDHIYVKANNLHMEEPSEGMIRLNVYSMINSASRYNRQYYLNLPYNENTLQWLNSNGYELEVVDIMEYKN